jgi:hypothetical protein
VTASGSCALVLLKSNLPVPVNLVPVVLLLVTVVTPLALAPEQPEGLFWAPSKFKLEGTELAGRVRLGFAALPWAPLGWTRRQLQTYQDHVLFCY